MEQLPPDLSLLKAFHLLATPTPQDFLVEVDEIAGIIAGYKGPQSMTLLLAGLAAGKELAASFKLGRGQVPTSSDPFQ